MIGVFDSGIGGLSVLRTLREALPCESFIYLGDGKRCPYGERSKEEVLLFTREAVERLLAEGCKLIVLACNTATAVAVKLLRESYPEIPFVGLEPAVKPAALSSSERPFHGFSLVWRLRASSKAYFKQRSTCLRV